MSSSAGTITRNRAMLSMTSPLGPDVLIPTALEAEEAISAPFLFRVEIVSAKQGIDPNELLRKPVCIRIAFKQQPSRMMHGMVRRFAAVGDAGRGLFAYTADVVPMLWFLSQTADCRIFQNMTVQQILQLLFADGGVQSVEFRIYGAKATREFTVQYNETDFDFATRLMQEEGYFYFFEHSESAHKLVVTDQNVAFQPIDQPDMVVRPTAERARDCITHWHDPLATALGQVELTDYDPTTPSKSLDATNKTTAKTSGAATRDLFHWPALTLDTSEVERRARLRMEAAEAEARIIDGAGSHAGFVPGGKFTLAKDPSGNAASQQFVIRRVVHRASDPTATDAREPPDYVNSFTAFPAQTTWRERQTVPRPAMAGIYSATVIGPDGEEIYTDKYGRVKIRFRFDHRKDATADGSCWVRVMQSWTSGNWGWQFLPRVGTEVGVAFMDGDPDRPVVMGGLFNGTDMPVFALPDEKTKSGLRTRSTPQGGSANFSEFSIEDKKGEELVLLHAEKDSKIEIENDETVEIGHNRTVTIKNDRSVTISEGNDTLEVKQGNRGVTVGQGNDTLEVQQGNRSVTIAQGNDSLDVKLGNITIKADLGGITVQAMQSIALKVGANSVTIDQTGVTIKGMMVSVEGETQTSVKGLMTQVSGSGMTQVSGGIIMIG